MDKIAKIHKIVCPVKFEGRCAECKNHYGYSDCPEQEQIDAILALIESEQDALYREAFNKGNQIGMATQSLEDKEIIKPMVEALKEAKKQILHLEDKCNKIYGSSDMVLAKIDAVLEGK